MNAYELADLIQYCNDYCYNIDAAIMLRQQADEIKALKLKTLTDQEILELWDWDSGEILATDLLDFADAILRKAQEK